MKADLPSQLNRPLAIGRTTIDRRLVLAPMTLLGHIAFRELLADFGGYGLLFGEMCGARRIPQEARTGSAYFGWREAERQHLVMQIFGADPTTMARAARVIEKKGLFGANFKFAHSFFKRIGNAPDLKALRGGVGGFFQRGPGDDDTAKHEFFPVTRFYWAASNFQKSVPPPDRGL